jgi:hypothetical protein
LTNLDAGFAAVQSRRIPVFEDKTEEKWSNFHIKPPIWRIKFLFSASDPAALFCGEHPGQAGGEHPRDVGHGQDRGGLDLWGAAGRHDGPPPLPHTVPEPSPGREALQRSAGCSDAKVRTIK